MKGAESHDNRCSARKRGKQAYLHFVRIIDDECLPSSMDSSVVFQPVIHPAGQWQRKRAQSSAGRLVDILETPFICMRASHSSEICSRTDCLLRNVIYGLLCSKRVGIDGKPIFERRRRGLCALFLPAYPYGTALRISSKDEEGKGTMEASDWQNPKGTVYSLFMANCAWYEQSTDTRNSRAVSAKFIS